MAAVERGNDVQGLWVRATLERTEPLAQAIRLGDVRKEPHEACAVSGVGQRVFEQLGKRGDAGDAIDQHDLLNFVLCLLGGGKIRAI